MRSPAHPHARVRERPGSKGAIDAQIDGARSVSSPAFTLSPLHRTGVEQVVAAAVCSPRACVRQWRLAEVVVGSVGDAVAQARAKATKDGDGGFPVYCGGGSVVSGEPANEGAGHDVKGGLGATGNRMNNQWREMDACIDLKLEVDLLRLLASTG